MPNDHARRDRAAFLASTTWHARKLAEAIAWLGPRYVLHPANRVQRRHPPAMPVLLNTRSH